MPMVTGQKPEIPVSARKKQEFVQSCTTSRMRVTIRLALGPISQDFRDEEQASRIPPSHIHKGCVW